MSDEKSESAWRSGPHKPKERNLSEMIQSSRAEGSGQVDLRKLLVQRTMARHDFTEEQALAVILAFGG